LKLLVEIGTQAAADMVKNTDFVVLLSDISKNDENEVGIEATRFAEASSLGIPIPEGFAVTANSFREFFFGHQKVPQIVSGKIFRAYKGLESPFKDANVVVTASFSKKKFKNVKGEANLMQKINELWKMYAEGKNIDYPSFEPAIFVYKIPDAPLSLIMFTIDPIENDRKTVVIFEGSDTGNQYKVSKRDLKIVSKILRIGNTQKISDEQIINLAFWGKKIQDYYYFPQEVEFCVDKDRIIVTKIKPLTTIGIKYLVDDLAKVPKKETVILGVNIPKSPHRIRRVLLKGDSIYPGIASGHIKIIKKPNDVHKLKTGDIAVVLTNRLRLSEVTNKSKALVLANHIYHISQNSYLRRIGKPVVVGTPQSNHVLREGLVATVNGINGEVYV